MKVYLPIEALARTLSCWQYTLHLTDKSTATVTSNKRPTLHKNSRGGFKSKKLPTICKCVLDNYFEIGYVLHTYRGFRATSIFYKLHEYVFWLLFQINFCSKITRLRTLYGGNFVYRNSQRRCIYFLER